MELNSRLVDHGKYGPFDGTSAHRRVHRTDQMGMVLKPGGLVNIPKNEHDDRPMVLAHSHTM